MPRLTRDDLLAAIPDVPGGSTSAPANSPSVGKPAPLQPVPALSPNWPVEIRLAKGRRVRATLVPGAARRDDVAALRSASAENTRRTFDALQEQGEAIDSLQRSHDELTKKVAAIQAQANRSVVGLLRGIEDLEQRLQTAKIQERLLRAQSVSAKTQAVRQQRELTSMATTARIQQVTAVVNSMQSAAFGEKGSLLNTNNVLLAANQLLWTFIDPILRAAGFDLGPSPSVLTWLSPVGTLVTGQVALGDRQHVRFISGVTTFDGSTSRVTESLKGRLASSFFKKFTRRTDVPVTATALDESLSKAVVRASVSNGDLTIRLEQPGGGEFLVVGGGIPAGRVAWVVDTGVDGG